jgi:hypothetical protein
MSCSDSKILTNELRLSSEATPGPWEIQTASGRLPVVREIKMPHGEASTFVASIRGSNGHLFRIDFGYGTKADAADARLIAAAPELLAQLKTAYAFITRDYPLDSLASGNWPTVKPVVDAMATAIAKAEGQ